MHKNINTNTDILQVRCQNKSLTGNIYNKIPQDKAKLGKIFCKMYERIKHNIDIVTVTNEPTSLVSVVNYSYYHWVFNEGTGIVSDVSEKALDGSIYWNGVIVNLFPCLDLLIYSKPISFLIGSTNVYRILFYQVYLLLRITNLPPFLNWVMWNFCDVVVGFCITSIYLSGYAKLCCGHINKSFPE